MNMKTAKQIAWAACLSAIGSAPALAQVYYVSPDGWQPVRHELRLHEQPHVRGRAAPELVRLSGLVHVDDHRP